MKINKILYPTNFLLGSEKVFSHALFLAEEYRARVHLIHVITPSAELQLNLTDTRQLLDNLKEQVEKRRDRIRKKQNVEITSVTIKQQGSKSIAEIRRSKCPVFTLKVFGKQLI